MIKKVFIIGIFSFLIFSLSSFVFAHGGDDHADEAGDLPIAQTGQLNSKLAKTSNTEILLKYATPIAQTETLVKIFVTDLTTNEPISNAQIKLNFNFLGNLQTSKISYGTVYADAANFEAVAATTNSPGIYQTKVTFPQVGNYGLKMRIAGSNIDANTSISGIVALEKQVVISSISWQQIIFISSATLLLMFFIWLFYRKIALFRQVQTKA
ncbi:MAG: hypothetical protein IPK14_11785 [Blastocatellia bacterium]|nr:hypothetical protein [Blastocatellia bacterium]MBL8196377.1 hypothetical protein [Blastocatellia bacterium]MBN8723919.1 hypothetical protein [Acidobacteriota bacterium]